MDMFEQRLEQRKRSEGPLAARMRPASLDAFVGQDHLVGEGRVLRKAIESGQIPSMILWGPPGSGKTTLANIIANTTDAHFSSVSAVSAGVADLRRIVKEAQDRRKLYQQKTVLFIDEIHRFNKAQQDAVLPYVEDGTVTLIGATTENPSFEVIAPLLSRSRLLTLNPLGEGELKILILRALRDPLGGLGEMNVEVDDEAMVHLVMMANHDARVALNALELAALTTPPSPDGKRRITLQIMEDAVQQRALRYDKAGDQHYDLISALHKSMRGSDPDATLYWLARMLEGGETPLFIARRLIRFASEDVGMADPQALVVAMAAQQAVHFIGMPEGSLALAEAAAYLATAPKSNALYAGYSMAQSEVKEGIDDPVPLHLRNPVTSTMKQLGYGEGYKYAHDYPEHYVEQQNLPDALQGKRFYQPSDQGFEKEITARMESRRPSKKKTVRKRSQRVKPVHVEFLCGDTTLEGELHLPEGAGPFPAVVVCHPHPLYGGDMHNNVVLALAKALVARSLAALRLNFRGVGGSGGSFGGGSGEREDVAAALDFLGQAEKVDGTRLGLAGYSFGGGVALPAAIGDERVRCLALVSPALSESGWEQLEKFPRPRLVIVGAADSVVKPERFRQIAESSGQPGDYHIVPGADHFWFGLDANLGRQVADFFAVGLER